MPHSDASVLDKGNKLTRQKSYVHAYVTDQPKILCPCPCNAPCHLLLASAVCVRVRVTSISLVHIHVDNSIVQD